MGILPTYQLSTVRYKSNFTANKAFSNKKKDLRPDARPTRRRVDAEGASSKGFCQRLRSYTWGSVLRSVPERLDMQNRDQTSIVILYCTQTPQSHLPHGALPSRCFI